MGLPSKLSGALSLAGFVGVALTPVNAFAESATSIRAMEEWYGGFRAILSFSDTDDPTLANPPAAGSFAQKNDGAEVNGGPGLMIGYNWAKDYDLPIRTELQIDYRVRHDADSRLFVNPAQSFDYDLNVDSLDVMFNVLYDIETGSWWQPYVGAGAGWSHLESEGSRRNTLTAVEESFDGTADNFAWSLQTGVLFDVVDSFALELGYRYIALGDIKPDAVSTGDQVSLEGLEAHELVIGTVFKF
jgi:opacity protein-like surface antigen